MNFTFILKTSRLYSDVILRLISVFLDILHVNKIFFNRIENFKYISMY